MCIKQDQHEWPKKEINSEKDVEELIELYEEKKWVFRGQNDYDTLLAPIDRPPLNNLNRTQKLQYEDESIRRFINSVKFTSDDIEKELLSFDPKHILLYSERRISILMLLQHFNCPTRLLDWSSDPMVALYFAVSQNYGKNENRNGEIWSFDVNAYNSPFGPSQWPKNQEVYDKNKKFDNRIPSIFNTNEPKGDWFVMQALDKRFHRLEHQSGYFSVCSKFGKDHASAIMELFKNKKYYQKFIIPKECKPLFRDYLKDKGIWHGSLFPDAAGVAHAFRKDIFGLDD